jgi:hypothetical protein
MNKMIKLLLLACAPVLLVAACGGGSDDLDDRLDVADPNVRFVHAVPLGPNLSLFRNDVAQSSDVTNVPYKGASNYFDVSEADATWVIKTTTGNVTAGTATFAATRGNKYTLVAIPGANAITELINIRDPYNKSLTTDRHRRLPDRTERRPRHADAGLPVDRFPCVEPGNRQRLDRSDRRQPRLLARDHGRWFEDAGVPRPCHRG